MIVMIKAIRLQICLNMIKCSLARPLTHSCTVGNPLLFLSHPFLSSSISPSIAPFSMCRTRYLCWPPPTQTYGCQKIAQPKISPIVNIVSGRSQVAVNISSAFHMVCWSTSFFFARCVAVKLIKLDVEACVFI